ncbi:lysozyme inhibitor LprI family protein [Puniceibacterium confluentis]|uniref:lysozyme inhibitor LprI family protein n=1 Tax=Puniceibacterium confluentis TaxID=1958944 RepID=UPI0011B732C9|nr:lysozyme inhibitor LprI family protein [Puniceibacterium confluentis]
MRRSVLALLIVLPATGWAAKGMAQPLDCVSPTTQVEMTGCAARAHEAADAELNAVWKKAMAKARDLDHYIGADEIPAVTILRDAQRAWIPYRDQACEAESLLARGGTLQSQLFYECLTRLTRTRTEDLAGFATEY